ncbi:MAG: hypothetical protein KUG73_06860 [Pseudomonadales bacterium]|nr:hypothetical protein [Pseudomonadales bacterium]
MGIPTKEELTSALDEAARMRESGEDPHFVAKALLNQHYQLTHLEHLYDAVQHYVNSGQSETSHSKLLISIEHYRAIQKSPSTTTR